MRGIGRKTRPAFESRARRSGPDGQFALAYAALARRQVFNGYLVSPTYLDSGLVLWRVGRWSSIPGRRSLDFAQADLLFFAGKPAAARLSYLKAIELNPSEIGALADLSDADDLTGRLDESLYWGLRAVALAPTSADVHAHAAVPLCRMAADEAAGRGWLARSERRWPTHGRTQHLLMRQELTSGLGPAAACARRVADLIQGTRNRWLRSRAWPSWPARWTPSPWSPPGTAPRPTPDRNWPGGRELAGAAGPASSAPAGPLTVARHWRTPRYTRL